MAGRILLEKAFSSKEAFFVTFTYNDEHQPKGFEKQRIQDFHRLTRLRLSRDFGAKYRYFFTCEYGDEKGRSHYHGIYLVDTPFPDDYDKPPFQLVGPRGGVFVEPYNDFKKVFRDYWKDDSGKSLGFIYFGTLTPASAKYCTAYALKEDDWYLENSQALAEGRIPPENIPFRLFSRKPGLGLDEKTVKAVHDYAYYGTEIRRCIKLDSETKFPVPRVYKQRLDDEELRDFISALGLAHLQDSQDALALSYEIHSKPIYTNPSFGPSMLTNFRIEDYSEDRRILVERKEKRILRKISNSANYAKKGISSF